ncbi:hypothetical protein HYPSUDRAFT_81247 [Hypholoma sublateritium FD-334 SS-4]|uniref:Uncharacterized protein n=1 Tax=Hypholoma sublateritium (strain FD-334 SS-4) TaxID=945553 RepID=A0A0D2LNE5_HYPSF|nr:hypothetical protein HYPSUDRAFT_81247 [Hypholoma sublateritium FD-334 SS-4]
MPAEKKPRSIHRRLKGYPRSFFDNNFDRVRPGFSKQPLHLSGESAASKAVNFSEEAHLIHHEARSAASSNYIEPHFGNTQPQPFQWSPGLLPYPMPVLPDNYSAVNIYPPISDNGTQYYCRWQPETNNLLVDAYYEDSSSVYNECGSHGAAEPEDTNDFQNNLQWDYQSRLQVNITDSPASNFVHGYNSTGIYTPHPGTVPYLSAPVAPTVEEVRALVLQSTPPPGFGNWVETVPRISNYDYAEISGGEVAEEGRTADSNYFIPNAVDENPHT